MIFFDSEVVVSPVVDFKTDSNLSVVIAVVVAEIVGELVSVMVSSLRLVLLVIGRHS